MVDTAVPVLGQRTLCAVYRFYDAFLLPADERTPPLSTPLEVSIPAFAWTAQRSPQDNTYRFSAFTLRQPAPSGGGLAVQVTAVSGDYLSLEPIVLALPLALSSPPVRADFLIELPLWPASSMRPPPGETAVRGHVRSASAQPVAGLKVEMWAGAAPLPPAGTPYTRTDANGDFLVRMPLLKARPGQALAVRLRLDSGVVPVVPASLSIMTGLTQVIAFQRT